MVVTAPARYFQSHFGLILSIEYFEKLVERGFAFNPILVWFYRPSQSTRTVPLWELSIPFWSDFIDMFSQKILQMSMAFNPILVWFYLFAQVKLWRRYIHLSIPFWSDFILESGAWPVELQVLSIPFWSDFISRYQFNPIQLCFVFQSHFGLILSEGYIGALGLTKLRLSIPFWSDFISWDCTSANFHPVILSIPFWSDFISVVSSVLTAVILSFQSHFGLILSQCHWCCVRKCYHPLSIPFWSDFILDLTVILINYTCSLSIPFWSDFISWDCTSANFHPVILSIPFWSDFIETTRVRQLSLTSQTTFNPILVWFYPKGKTAWSQCLRTFNPILVWFYLLSVNTDKIVIDVFQSHFGLILSGVCTLALALLLPAFNPILVWFYLELWVRN